MESNKEKFSLIYDQYIEKIYRFVYLKVNSVETAEDLTSKVFLKGWQAYQEGKIKNHGAFLYQIARNKVVDYYREKGKTRIVSIDNFSQIIDDGTNLHEKAILNESIKVVKSAILNLEKNYQDVLIWYYLDDMSTENIAKLLNKSVGTVRVMIHRGLKALKDELIQKA